LYREQIKVLKGQLAKKVGDLSGEEKR